jgi:phospholipid/cholesterol/gamma-HCH transport system permease protein
MIDAARDSSPHWQLETAGGQNRVTLSGDWTAQHGSLPRFPADGLRSARPSRPVVFDTAALGRWNSALITFLWEVRQAAEGAGIAFDGESLPPSASKLLGLLPAMRPPPNPPRRGLFNPLAVLGGWTLDSLTETGMITELTAATAWNGARALMGRSRMRGVDLLANVRDAGPDSLLIVGIVNFLLGAILAFVGAVQLEKFAAGVYVADLVGIAMVREMAAVMTAIIMAGRTGGAYAARIATMLGNEEIDALTVSGIPVSSYLILPSVLALVITMPLLYLYGCLVSMMGGCVVAVAMLRVTLAGYVTQTLGAVPFSQCCAA